MHLFSLKRTLSNIFYDNFYSFSIFFVIHHLSKLIIPPPANWESWTEGRKFSTEWSSTILSSFIFKIEIISIYKAAVVLFRKRVVVHIWCKIITKLYNISKETPYTTPTQNSNTLQKRIIRALSRRKLAVKKKGKITLTWNPQ